MLILAGDGFRIRYGYWGSFHFPSLCFPDLSLLPSAFVLIRGRWLPLGLRGGRFISRWEGEGAAWAGGGAYCAGLVER